jgi:hypothetical protein
MSVNLDGVFLGTKHATLIADNLVTLITPDLPKRRRGRPRKEHQRSIAG